MSNMDFTQLSADFIDSAMSFLDEDTFTSLPLGEKELVFEHLLEQVVKKRQKERDRHALQVLVDVFCYKQGYEVSYGPRSEWIRENRKRLAEVLRKDEDKVEAFFEPYKMVDCGNCEDCIRVRAREREGDGGQDARLS